MNTRAMICQLSNPIASENEWENLLEEGKVLAKRHDTRPIVGKGEGRGSRRGSGGEEGVEGVGRSGMGRLTRSSIK